MAIIRGIAIIQENTLVTRHNKLQTITNLQSTTKWVETLRPKEGFFTFYELQKEEI